MTALYLESSALAKRYLKEPGSAWVVSLFAPPPAHTVFIAAITGVEVIAAITRAARGGIITPGDAAAVCAQFRADLLVDYQVVEVSEVVLARAMDLAQSHGLRGYDAVQLASALAVHAVRSASGLPALTLVSADKELNTVARIEGLPVEDPNTHP